MADHFPLKRIYVIGIAAQIPCFYLMASYTGIPLILVCFLATTFNSGILSSENMLLARFTPQKHHGLVFGLKFILAFGAGPLAVYYVARIYEMTQEFVQLFITCAIIVMITTVLTSLLPVKESKLN